MEVEVEVVLRRPGKDGQRKRRCRVQWPPPLVEQPTQSTAATRTAVIAFMLPPVGGVMPPLGPLLPQDCGFHGTDNPTLPAFCRGPVWRTPVAWPAAA